MNKFWFLTISRFFAAIFVVFYHFSRDIDFPLNTFLQQWSISVSYFFTLSGFILLLSNWSKKEQWRFTLKSYYVGRIARIYPLFLLSLIPVFIIHTYWNAEDTTFFHTALSVLWLQAFFPWYALSLNYPSWSLSVEFFFYALFPLYLWYANSRNIFIVGWVVMAIYLISQLSMVVFGTEFVKFSENVFWEKSQQFIHYFPLLHLSSFLVWMLGARLFLELQKCKVTRFESILLIASIGLFITILLTHKSIFLHNGLLAPLFVTIIILLARLETSVHYGRLYNSFVLLGESSYAIYILQLPIHLALIVASSSILWVKDPLAIFGGGYFIVYLCVLILASIISFMYIETPSRLWCTWKLTKLVETFPRMNEKMKKISISWFRKIDQ